MTLTKQWINKQISEYQVLLGYLDDSENDKLLRGIYKATVNTLAATLEVIKLEDAA
jgi:hypothetical protein